VRKLRAEGEKRLPVPLGLATSILAARSAQSELESLPPLAALRPHHREPDPRWKKVRRLLLDSAPALSLDPWSTLHIANGRGRVYCLSCDEWHGTLTDGKSSVVHGPTAGHGGPSTSCPNGHVLVWETHWVA
jgi:hypothetical protein